MVAESYAACRAIARAKAKNFYYAFVLLPREQRDSMCAIYAFMRYCDDLVDEPGAGREGIARSRQALNAMSGPEAFWPAFQDTVRRYSIPLRYFHDLIDGMEWDLDLTQIETFDELYRYCYHAASVVGLVTIHVFGFRSPAALPLAEKCGVAFQLTNILRDVVEDAGRGRVYIPAEDMRRFGVTKLSPAARDLLRFEGARARAYYEESAPLVEMVHPHSRAALRALIGIYSALLDKIERTDYDVFSRRVALSKWEKLAIVLRSLT